MLLWASFGNDYITKAFERAGVELSFFDFPQKEEDTRHSEELATKVLFAIQEKGVDAVFSFNYFPVVAIAAKAAKVKYISWTYDSPYIQLYSRTIEYDTNYAFVFDQNEYNNLKALGLNTVYYLPMAADTSYYDSITISDKDHKRFDADIAMIGSMYNEKHNNLVRHFEGLDEYTSGYVTGIMAAGVAGYKLYKHGHDIASFLNLFMSCKDITPICYHNCRHDSPILAKCKLCCQKCRLFRVR